MHQFQTAPCTTTTSRAPLRRVVVAGANGPTGRLLLLLLRDADVHVTALVRQPVRLVADEVVADWTRSERSFEVIAEADAVILLTGVFAADSWDAYRSGMVDTAERIAAAVGERDTRVIYFSHIGADVAENNWYLKAKGWAEQALARLSNVVIFRHGPVVRGSPQPLPFELSLQQRAPDAPVTLYGSGEQRCRPINLGDIATIAEAAALGAGSPGTYELGGPDEHSLVELVQLVNGRRVPVQTIAVAQAGACAKLPATVIDLIARTQTPHPGEVEATAAHFGVQLTPLSLAWPLDDLYEVEEELSLSLHYAQNP
ncbi:putative nucleoside-diphosphate sugar epimerase [Herbaspirillum sp. CF444]|uniref:SDR family oxidoreductase n=1 Tax=Herbaspirillum sp. CF444 TaxID=1144319 RepID=UPI00027245DC|nr:NAD(P)H-binding protein [Herbaspirillum sp. CF444]EJL90038.1 putative nucleoside-diphosphate sugar epimerase [Herbaspirillum sp. CF444]